MTFPPRATACALVVSTLLSTAAAADEYFRQHEAHQHGVVEFNIAQDGQDLLLEITAPGADIVGFEHAPISKDQKQALQKALSQLEKTMQLFSFNQQAQCKLSESYITETLTAHHDKERNHDKHHDHHEHDSHGEHGSFSAQYNYHCKTINALQQMEISWFKYFPSTEKITVQAITEKSQQASQLTPNSTTFIF